MAESEIIKNIKEAGKKRKLITMVYAKKYTEETKNYILEPYEIKEGYFWGFNIDKNHIEKFIIGNIVAVEITEYSFIPRWEIRLSTIP